MNAFCILGLDRETGDVDRARAVGQGPRTTSPGDRREVAAAAVTTNTDQKGMIKLTFH
jgi:hypothetical protein